MKLDKETANGVIRIMKLGRELGTKSIRLGDLEIVFDSKCYVTENITKKEPDYNDKASEDIEFDFKDEDSDIKVTDELEDELRMIVDSEAWEKELLNANQETHDLGATPTL